MISVLMVSGMSARDRINIVLIIFIVTLSIALKCLPLSKERKLSIGYKDHSFLNFTEAAAKNHYSSEEHTVVTEDDYILTIFRLTKPRKCQDKLKQRPVLIMHGLFQNSDIFLDAGPSGGLAYLLSDDCYDVWVGNQRGNNYARKHLQLDPDKDVEFWQFSADEIGFYDVPAMVDHILNHTGMDKINYIGFSQGGGTFFMMCSERPGYCEKTALMIALAPAVILHNQESVLTRLMLQTAVYFQRIFQLFGVNELFSKGAFFQELYEYLCQSPGTWTEEFCGSGGFLDNYHPGSITPETQQLIYSHFMVGTSLNTLVRYGQVLHSGKFQKFDYGETENLARYNSRQAPEYKLSAVSAPVVFIQGKNDNLINVNDTKMVASKLPNVLDMVVVADPDWTHLDMIYSKNMKTMVYPKICKYLQKYSKRDN